MSLNLKEVNCSYNSIREGVFYILEIISEEYRNEYYLYKKHGGTLYEDEMEDITKEDFLLSQKTLDENDPDAEEYMSFDDGSDFDAYKQRGYKLYEVVKNKFYLDM